MARAIWSGSISFGLVNVPVRLHTATEEKDISFHQFDERSGKRIRMKRVREDNGREVEYKNIVKGYETAKGKYVMITPDELAAADPRRTKTIDIEDFVELADIDPIYFAKTYYLEPGTGDGAKHAYALLREAMDKTGRAAIGRFVFRTKQYLIVLRPLEDCLTITTLYFADEVRDRRKLEVPRRVKTNPRELKIATQLIDSLTTEWKPEKYDDTYRERVLKIIRDKAKGKEITVEEPEKVAPVTDLLAALQASLDRKPKKATRARKPTRARKSA